MTSGSKQADRFCANLGIEVSHGGDRAFYAPTNDVVQMPEFQRFHDGVSYYAVLLHECGHATAPSIASTAISQVASASEAYAMEECIVELLSAMICADLSISVDPRPITPPTSRPGSRCCATTLARSSPHQARLSRPPTGCTRGNSRGTLEDIEGLHETSRSGQSVSLRPTLEEPLTRSAVLPRFGLGETWLPYG